MHSNIEFLISEIIKLNPLQKSFLDDSLKRLSSEELSDLNNYLEYCLSISIDIPYLAKCYDLIVKDTLREQIYFTKHKQYRYSTYDEVASKVYLNDEYMQKYMYGLAITSFLWPNHHAMKEFFLKTLPRDKKGTYVEIGPGHGFYFMTSLLLTAYDRFEGIDISPKSVEMTNSILKSNIFGEFSNYEIYCKDFFDGDMPQNHFDAVVSGEVLEHLEDPKGFLKRIKEISHKDSYIYVTTCINAPAVDHIFLFESVQHLVDIVNDAGLSVKEEFVVPYFKKTIEETVEQQLPLNIALELKHPNG